MHLRDGSAVRLAALDLALAGDESAAIEAFDTEGRRVGRATYVRMYGPRAELALDVERAYRHRGLPETLIASIANCARLFDIGTLVMRVPVADVELLALLREDFAARETPRGRHVDVDVSTAIATRSGWTTEPDERSSPMAPAGGVHSLAGMTTPLPSLSHARVADVMHGPVIACGPETPIQDVAQTMADARVHAVVVEGIERTAWSVVTALDLAAAAATDDVDGVARDVAGTEPVTVRPDTPLTEAARIMVEHQVNHLLVADAEGHPEGVVSTSDVARCFAGDGD